MTVNPANHPDLAVDLGQFVAALYGASQDPFRLVYGDTTVDVSDDLTPVQTAAGANPLLLATTTARGGVPFLYATTEEPTPDAWQDMLSPGLAVYPTAILTKDRTVCAVYALSDEAAADDAAVIALADAMGGALENPVPTPGGHWVLVYFDADRHTPLQALQDAFGTAAPAVVAIPATPVSGLGRYKDATIRSVFDFEDPRLAEPITVSMGVGVKDTNWEPLHTSRLGALDGFCTHRVARKKDSAAMVLGKLPSPDRGNERESNRRNSLIEEVWMVGLDFDTGVSGDDLGQAMIDAKLMGVLASTYSHLTTTTTETYRSFALWMVETGRADNVEEAVVDREVVRARMAAEPKKIVPAIVDTMEIEITGEGNDREVVITHAPLPKWRLILPLDRPFIPADHDTAEEEGFRVWRGVAPALARRLGGLPFDHACVDPARLWYLPNHPAERPDYRIDLFGGDLLSLEDILAEAAELAEVDATGPRSGRVRKASTTASTGPFNERWIAREGAGFEIVDLLTEVVKPRQDPKLKLVRGMRGKGKVTVRCPFADGHGKRDTNESAGAFASAPDSGRGEGFTIYCSHGSCQSQKRDRLTYLNKMLADGWFTEAEARAYETIQHEGTVEPEVDVEAALAEYACVGGLASNPEKPKPVATTGYPLPKAAGKFELTEVDGRKFFAFPPDDEGKGGGLTFSRWTLVGGAIHPDRAGLRDLEIAFENEAGHRETFRIPADKAANKAYAIGVMRGQGIAFGSAQGETVAHRILMMTQPTNQIVRDRTGWLEDGVFMLPTGAVVGATDGSDVRLSDVKRIDASPTAGTLDAWKEGAAAACNSTSPSLHAGLLAGFAGPLTGLTGQATLVLAFTGTTTEGKTWRQQVGVAVSGPPEPGVGQMKSMNATIGALEIPLERGSCTIAAFDELHHAEAADVQNLIFRASGQQGRARLSQSGAAGLTRAWKGGVVTLSTETGLAQRLRQAGETLAGGTTVRLVEVDVTVNRLVAGEWERADVMLKNYGHALPVFIEEVRRLGYVDKPSALSKRVREFVETLEGTDTPVAVRAATAVGYLCVAGEIAKGTGLLPASFDVEAVGRTLWEGALGSEMRAEDPIDRAIETLMESINARRHEIADAGEDRNPNREIMAWVSDHHGVPVYCVRGKVLSKWAGGAADERVLKKALLDRGLAIPYVRSKTVGGKTKTTETAIWPKWKAPVGMSGVMVIRASAVDGTDSRPHA